MKWFLVKLVMISAVAIGMLNYVLYLKTGKSPLAELDFSLSSLSVPDIDVPDVSLPSLDDWQSSDGEPIVVYKWVGEDGVINYSQVAPEGVANVESMKVDPSTNVLPAEKIPEPEVEEKPAVEVQAEPRLNDMALLPTPDRVQKLMQDAKNIQSQMNARTQQLDAVLQDASEQ